MHNVPGQGGPCPVTGMPAIFLLQSLSFGINWKKSQLTSGQELEYLGFLVNTLHDAVITRGENPEDTKVLSEADCQTVYVYRGCLELDREVNSLCSGHFGRSSLLQEPSDAPNRKPHQVSVT